MTDQLPVELRIHGGQPSSDELAALAAVLATRLRRRAAALREEAPGPRRASWDHAGWAAAHRRPTGSWRTAPASRYPYPPP
ncbi:hypothetical protein ABZS76_10450 [Streptomyces sp. NPDC005562]|uniref:hypothetical protein n=1 Tax=unclassified Streptomyces TaxID=2593676 RepID=UPI0033B933E9